MIKVSFFISLISFLVLDLPDWHPPYTYAENWIVLVALFGLFGPWVLIGAAVFNRLLNISFPYLNGGVGRYRRTGRY